MGLNKQQYDDLVKKAGGRCEICGEVYENAERSDGRVIRNMVVDHCHHTGKIRGYLCRFCNTGLGSFKDKVDVLSKAARYLELKKQDE